MVGDEDLNSWEIVANLLISEVWEHWFKHRWGMGVKVKCLFPYKLLLGFSEWNGNGVLFLHQYWNKKIFMNGLCRWHFRVIISYYHWRTYLGFCLTVMTWWLIITTESLIRVSAWLFIFEWLIGQWTYTPGIKMIKSQS